MTVLFGIVWIVIGLFNLLAPRETWELKVGYKFKNAEPSDDAMTIYRLKGIGFILLGFLFIIIW